MKCAICGNEFVASKFHPYAKTCTRKCSGKLEYKKHKDKYIERASNWQRANPLLAREYQKKSHAKNPEKYRAIWTAKQQRRECVMRNAPGIGITHEQWLAVVNRQAGLCWWCGEEKRLTMDHVQPVSKGGAHSIENIVGACQSCNARKRAQLWPLGSGKLAPLYSLLALLTLCVISGCASKKHESTPPDSARLFGCHEVSVDAKTGYITVICPPQVKK